VDDLLPAETGEEAGAKKTKQERQRDQDALEQEQNRLKAPLSL
jgi:hypothetical protein